ncbi:MAG: hypothetical protein HQK85_03910 [Nitrospinae bacterium]|nr:hypothetical protein [Nitrospinota bacterium]
MPTPKLLAHKWEAALPSLAGQWTHWRLDGDGVEIGIYSWQELGDLLRTLDANYSRFSSIYAELARIDEGSTTPTLQGERVLITDKARDSALFKDKRFFEYSLNHENAKKTEPLWMRLFVRMIEWVDGEEKPKPERYLLKKILYILKVAVLFFFVVAFFSTLYTFMWAGPTFNLGGFILGLTMLPLAIIFAWAWLFVWVPRIFRSGQSVAPERAPIHMLPIRTHVLMNYWVGGVFIMLLGSMWSSIYSKWLMDWLMAINPQLSFLPVVGIFVLFSVPISSIWPILDELIPARCPRCAHPMDSRDHWKDGDAQTSFFAYSCRSCGLRWIQNFLIWGKIKDRPPSSGD